MGDFCEVRVRIKNEEETSVKKFPCYNKITLARNCPVLMDMVEKTREVFTGTHGDVTITAVYEWGQIQEYEEHDG